MKEKELLEIIGINRKCCANMRFIPKQETKEILRKYSINKKEYDEICKKLEKGLSFGSCGWCS